MAGDEIPRTRQELERSFSEGQVELLRAIRNELSSQRWQVMLEIDGAQHDLRVAQLACGEAPVRTALESVQARLARAHRQLAHIPEDVIPAF
jgi:hypothetical protein